MKTALIAGSTGLIGRQLLNLILNSDKYDKVIALTRQPLTPHPKLVEVPITKDAFPSLDPTWKVDDVFCCLGTTMAKARSKQKFYQVDFAYPLELAKQGLAHGARQYLIVSALGASKNSKVYYNQVKGEIEEAISSLGFETVHIFRPSLLLGSRTEHRSAEEAAKVVYKIFGFLIPRKYKAIDSLKVACAMLHFAIKDQAGKFIHESNEMQQF